MQNKAKWSKIGQSPWPPGLPSDCSASDWLQHVSTSTCMHINASQHNTKVDCHTCNMQTMRNQATSSIQHLDQ